MDKEKPQESASMKLVRAELKPELEALEKIWFEKGRASVAGGSSAAMATAEKLADRARELQASTPGLSSVEAVRKAYTEAGVTL